MNELIKYLMELQSLEFEATLTAETEPRISELRAKIPAPILGHYDRLLNRGKKGVAPVRNQVCCECHMQVSRSALATLIRGQDVQLCECCGRYLYLAEPVVFKTEPPRKRRNRKPEAELVTAGE